MNEKCLNLIDYFLIIGKQEIHEKRDDNNLKDMTILNCISSNVNNKRIDDKWIIQQLTNSSYCFPHSHSLSVIERRNSSMKKKFDEFSSFGALHLMKIKKRVNSKYIIFTKKETDNTSYVFSLHFYDNNKQSKYFCIISQFPYFLFYYHLSCCILRTFQRENVSIPIEIFLYNIISYIPSPTNWTLFVEFLSDQNGIIGDSLNKTFKQDITFDTFDYNLNKQITLFQHSFVPYFDFSILDIVLLFSINTFIKLFVFSFLEIKMYFFSLNIQLLNPIVFLLKQLSYPFNEIDFFDIEYAITEEDLIKQKQLNHKITCINCEYQKELLDYLNDTECIHIDLDRDSISVIGKENQSSVQKLNEQINKIIDALQYRKYKEGKKQKNQLINNDTSNTLSSAVQILFNLYYTISKEKNINDNQSDIINCSNMTGNSIIQSSIYLFHCSLLHIIYSQFSIHSNYDYFLSKYEKINVSECKYYMDTSLNYDEDNENKLFCKMFQSTEKFKIISKLDCNDPSLLFLHKILNYQIFYNERHIKETRYFDNLVEYVRLYQTKKKYVNFHTFISYYNEHFSPFLIDEANMIKPYELSKELIYKYVYLLENISDDTFKQLFPFYSNHNDKKNQVYTDISMSLFLLRKSIKETNDKKTFIITSLLIISYILLLEDYQMDKQIMNILLIVHAYPVYYGELLCLFIQCNLKLIHRETISPETEKNIIKVNTILVEYIISNNIIPTQTVLNAINAIAKKESFLFRIVSREQATNKKNINKDRGYKIVVQNNKGTEITEEVQKAIVSIKNEFLTNTLKGTKGFQIMLPNEEKCNNVYKILEPLTFLEEIISLFEVIYGNVDLIDSLHFNIINYVRNSLLYSELIQDFTEFDMSPFIDYYIKHKDTI